MQLPIMASSSGVDRIDSGEGVVNEHSIEIGNSVLVFNNIGSFTINDGKRNLLPIIVGAILILVGVGLLTSQLFSGAVIVLLVGAALVVYFFVQKPDVFLAIGTCDGRRTTIVSKDRAFLRQVLRFMLQKIDNNMLTAKIDITAGTISGGIAFGDHASAAGAYGKIRTPATHEQ